MVDYEKLYIDLFNEITKTIESLEKAREDAFKKFAESDPSKAEVKRFSENINLKNNNHDFFK